MQLLTELQQYGVDTRSASDAGIDEVVELAEQLKAAIERSQSTNDTRASFQQSTNLARSPARL